MKLQKAELIKTSISECKSSKAYAYEDEVLGLVYSGYHIQDLDVFSDEFKSQYHNGIYLETGLGDGICTYAGKSDTSVGDGVAARIKGHMREGHDLKYRDKPKFTKRKNLKKILTILNADENRTAPLSAEVIQSLEHIFYLIFSTTSDNLNSESNSIFKLGDRAEELFRYIYPIIDTVMDIAEGDLAVVVNNLKVGVNTEFFKKAENCDKLSVDPALKTEVIKKQNMILRGSYFQLDKKVLKFNGSVRSLLVNLINAGVCVPYIYEMETVIVFIQNLDLDEQVYIRTNTSFMVDQPSLKTLMQARDRQQIWIKI